MIKLQEDLISIYNSLTEFGNNTLNGGLPLRVTYDSESKVLVFSQQAKTLFMVIPNYYSKSLLDIKDSFLLPEDYEYVMASLRDMINSGKLLEDRTTLSPEDYGFSIYSINPLKPELGPQLLGRIRFITSNNPIWIWWMRRKYKNKV